MSLIDLTLNGVTLASACPEAVVTNVNRPLAGAVRDELVDVPGRDGAWTFDEEPGDVTITIDIAVLVDTPAERRTSIATLRSWARTPSGRAPLIVSDETDRFWDVKLASAPPLVDDELVGVTQLSFSARPYAFSTTLSTEEFTAGSNPDSGSFVESLDFPAEPIIELTPQGGNFTGFLLEFNGSTFEWFGTAIAAGETITISTLSQTVTVGANDDMELTGVFDADAVSMGNVSTDGFPELVDGTNEWSLAWNGTATSVDVTVTWRERFI